MGNNGVESSGLAGYRETKLALSGTAVMKMRMMMKWIASLFQSQVLKVRMCTEEIIFMLASRQTNQNNFSSVIP